MEKVWKRLIAVSLSLMLMFTMGLNVFAAETVVTPNDNPAVELDEGDTVATEAEPASEEEVLEEESSDEAVVQEEEPAEEAVVQEAAPEVTAMGDELTAESENIELAITNNTDMFKAVSAYLTTENDQEYLVMALSGTGYKELYKGTYEAAVENGDGSADKGNNTWIHSTTNDAGKYEFTIPLNADESFVPVVAISNSYYTKYLNGQNDLSRAFYPRQFTVNREAKTLVTDDYNETSNFTVTSNVADFKVADAATTHVVGGPNSNNYSVAPTLVMEDSTYDKVTFPTVVSGAISTAEVTLEDGKFAISMTNAPNKEAFKDKTPIEMTFHVAEDAPYAEAGTDVVRTVTIDKAAKTIVIDGTALRIGKIKYDGTIVQFINKDGKAFGMWTPQEGSTYTYSDGKIHLSIIPKNTTIYGWMHWGGINEELTKDVALDSDGKIVVDLDSENCGWAVPVAPIKAADDTATTSSQYYLAVPALENFDADYTAVDAALETVPADLSIYTEETAAAVNEAVNAVVRGKKAVEQADVDGMADAIEKAVKGLRVAKFEYEGTTVQFIKKDGSAFGMWTPQEGSTYTYSDGKIHISITPKNTTVYGWMHWGGINEELTKDVALDSDGKIVVDLDSENCGWAVPVAPIKAADDTATTSSQYYLAVPALENFDADYTAVDAALETVPADLSIYTEETAAAVNEAVNAVVRGKKAVEQADVDGMADAIEKAVKGLRVAKFEYEGTTVQFIKKDGSAFGMWTPQEGSTYTYSDGKIHISITPKNTTVYGWMHWGGINEELTKDVELDSDGKIVFDLDTENCGWAVPVAPIKKKDGATTSDQYYLAVPALENFDADYAAVDEALATVPADLSIYTEETAAAVTEAVNAVVRDKKANEQADVDGMANAIDQAVKALVGKLSFATIDVPAQTYTGKALTPATVTFDGKTLVKDTDYTVEYSSNTNVGTATVTINGTGNYTGTKTAEFKINAKKITPAVTLSTTTYTYNGKAKTPAVTVKDGAKKLTKNTDYTVSYAKGRINAGSYKVTVKLMGNYSGSAYKTIKINPAAQKLTMSAAQKSVKFKALKKKAQTTSKVAVSGAKTKVTYAKVSGSSKLTINKTTGKITVKKKTKKGTYSIKVKATAAKSTNYKAATVTKTIKVRVK